MMAAALAMVGLPAAAWAAGEAVPAPGASSSMTEAQAHFLLKSLVIEGVSAYQIKRDLAPLYEKHLNQLATVSSLGEIAQAIARKYTKDGYLYCQVAVPPQKVGPDGVVHLRVFESHLGKIVVPDGTAEQQKKLLALLGPLRNHRPLRQDILDRMLDKLATLPGMVGTFKQAQDGFGSVDIVLAPIPAKAKKTAAGGGAHLSVALPEMRPKASATLASALSVGGGLGNPTVSAVSPALAEEHIVLAANDPPQLPNSFPIGSMPGHDRPIPEASAPAALDFTIQAPRRSPVPRSVEELVFDIKDIKVTGVTAYTAEDIQQFTAPLAGKSARLADLIALAEKIEGKYREDGFVLTRAIVPTQSVGDGVFQISVIEGFVAAASVNGGDESTRDRIDRLLAPVLASKPLALPVIERALLSANELPGVSVSGLLRPSASEAGASDLVVTVHQAPMSASLSFDDSGSVSSNPWTIAADTSFASPLDDGGLVSLSASAAPHVLQRDSLSMRYVMPLAIPGLNATFSALGSHGEPAGSIAPLKLVSDSTAFGGRLSYNLLLTRDDKLSLDSGLTVQSANVSILKSPFSHDEWRVADLSLSYQNSRFLDGVTNITTSVAEGLPLLGASTDGSPRLSRSLVGHPDFTKVNAIFRRVQPLDSSFSVSASAQGQYAFEPLLTGEETSFGGPGVGRGYDPGATSGDLGVGGSLELRYDLDAADLYADFAQLYSFYDSGVTWVKVGRSIDNRVRSSGLGIRTMYFSNYSLNLEFGHVIDPLPSSDNGRHTSRLVLSGSLRF